MSKGSRLDIAASQAIVACISIGAGSMTNFKVNGLLISQLVEWNNHCVIDHNYGGVCADGKLIVRLYPSDTWSCDEQHTKGYVYNRIDSSKVPDVKNVKKRMKKTPNTSVIE